MKTDAQSDAERQVNRYDISTMNLKMKPYGCVSTGDELGMLEVVPDANTITKIVTPRGKLLSVVDTVLNTKASSAGMKCVILYSESLAKP